MICPNCGSQIPHNYSFCNNCGARISQQAPGIPISDKKDNRKLIALLASLFAVIVAVTVTSVLLWSNRNESSEADKPVTSKSSAHSDKEKAKKSDNKKDASSSESSQQTAGTDISAENLIPAMSSADRTDINIFFSNFSEAGFSEYSKDTRNNDSLIWYAYTHNLLNNYSAIEYSGTLMGLSYDTANRTIDRFFGVTVPRESTNNGNYGWDYTDGMFWMPSASGVDYNYFSIVTEMHDIGGGLFSAVYDVFYTGYDFPSQECYSMSPEEAKSEYDYEYSVSAVIKAKNYNGMHTYEVISLSRK